MKLEARLVGFHGFDAELARDGAAPIRLIGLSIPRGARPLRPLALAEPGRYSMIVQYREQEGFGFAPPNPVALTAPPIDIVIP